MVTLNKDVSAWLLDYRENHAGNYELIEDELNRIATALGLGSSSELAVPSGLQEIFDRKGVIGVGSYDFNEGTLSGPNYYLTVAAGAFWNGSDFRAKATSTNISMLGKSTGTYYLNIDAGGNPSVSSSASAESTTRSFYWNNSTYVISAKALYTGVNILFDGDDYHDCLDSAALSQDFESMADRFENLEQSIDPFSGYYAQGSHSGLDFYYTAGIVRNDSSIYNTSAGYVTLTDDTTNYVELDPSDGSVDVNTSSFTSGKIPLYQVVTASGAISTVTDKRTAAIVGTGGGGGHTQNTDTGTTGTSFTLDSDATGSPTGRVQLIIENGSDLNAILAFNRDTDKFEISYDGGSSWQDLATTAELLGEAEFSKYVAIEDPDLVLEDLARSSSVAWETLDLSSYIDSGEAPIGAQAALLVIYFWDDTPGSGTYVTFRKGGSSAEPTYGYSFWSGALDPHVRAIPLNDDDEVEFWVNASGSGTANIRVAIIGYYAKTVGVGPASVVMTKSGISVGAGATVQNNYTGWLNDGEAWYFKIDETGGSMTGTYDVAIYAKDNFLEGTDQDDLIYKAEGIQPTSAFIDRLPFWCRDDDGTAELHFEIVNNDGSNGGVFTFTIKAKRFS